MVAILEVNQLTPTPSSLGRDSLGACQANRLGSPFNLFAMGSSVWDRRICPFLILPRKERSVRYHGQIPCVRYYCLIVRIIGFKIRNSPSMMEGSLFFVRLIRGMTTIYMETKNSHATETTFMEFCIYTLPTFKKLARNETCKNVIKFILISWKTKIKIEPRIKFISFLHKNKIQIE